jgi:lactoylglutathione lyase
VTLALVHTCVRVRDIDASVRFYEALGFERRGKLDFGQAYNRRHPTHPSPTTAIVSS